MNGQRADITRLLKRLTNVSEGLEVVYVNNRLLDDLFEGQFGGITNLLQAMEETDEVAFRTEVGVGAGDLLKPILEIIARIRAEGTISEQARTLFERQLTLPKKIRLCEASLDDKSLVIQNPDALGRIGGKYLKFVNKLSTYTQGNEGRLEEELGGPASQIVIERWRSDQALTPGVPQVVLATARPSPTAAIVKVQSEVGGSTYIAYPPPSPARREVLAKSLGPDRGVTFLKTYWVVDIGRDI